MIDLQYKLLNGGDIMFKNSPFEGIGYLLQGFSLLTRSGLKRFVIVPMLLNILFFSLLGINGNTIKNLIRKLLIGAIWVTISMIPNDIYPVWIMIVMNTDRIDEMRGGIKPKKSEEPMKEKQNNEGPQYNSSRQTTINKLDTYKFSHQHK